MKKNNSTSTPWNRIKSLYLTGNTTYKQLSKKFKISENMIAIRAGKEKWTDEKQKVQDKVNEKLPEKISDKIVETNTRHHQLGGVLISQGIKAMQSGIRPTEYKDAQMSIVHGVDIQRKSLNLEDVKQPVLIQINFKSKELEEWAS